MMGNKPNAPSGRRRSSSGARKSAQRGSERLELGLIGRDVGGPHGRRRLRSFVPIVAAALIVALGVAALRIDLLRIRYALADSLAEEQRLLDEQRALTLRLRQLRDPVRLAEKARALGFVRPERLVDLRDVRPGTHPATPTSTEAVLADAGSTAALQLDRP